MVAWLGIDVGQVLISSGTLIQRLDQSQRLRVLAALGVILTLGALLVLFIRLAGRMARWYARDDDRHPRWTPRSIASQDGLGPDTIGREVADADSPESFPSPTDPADD